MAVRKVARTTSFLANETDGTKQCGCCEKILPIARFPASGVSRDRLRVYCNFCAQIVKHGISYKQYKSQLKKQGNRCPICKAKFTPKRKPHIDHDHNHCEGVFGCQECFRGLLCFQCNNGLGALGDCRYTLQRAVKYLEEWK